MSTKVTPSSVGDGGGGTGVPPVRLKTDGKADARKGELGSADQTGLAISLDKKFRKPKSYGSRMVGGKKPTNNDIYNSYESVSYLTPDTVAVESSFLQETPKIRSRQLCMKWVRFAFMGIIVSLVIFGTLKICKTIEKYRVKTTTYYLDDDNLLGGWLFWTGTSLAMNIVACLLVLLQPAAASSGIPG